MPAAAVIPALIAYTKVAAVKKLVVELWRSYVAVPGPRALGRAFLFFPFEDSLSSSLRAVRIRSLYFEEIGVFKAGLMQLNILAWNNKIGRTSYFVGF